MCVNANPNQLEEPIIKLVIEIEQLLFDQVASGSADVHDEGKHNNHNMFTVYCLDIGLSMQYEHPKLLVTDMRRNH